MHHCVRWRAATRIRKELTIPKEHIVKVDVSQYRWNDDNGGESSYRYQHMFAENMES